MGRELGGLPSVIADRDPLREHVVVVMERLHKLARVQVAVSRAYPYSRAAPGETDAGVGGE